ncbi:MAG: helix-turn-helix domain-containing protein [Alphaproteobacteria bacterium]|nr:helix-turn-helix domain-containing protein [Alphaproteobacteria bacterium]
MNHVVILSEEKLFCEALADAASRELGVEVTTIESAKSLAKLESHQVSLLVSTLPVLPAWQGRVLRYKPGVPHKITAMLDDIFRQLNDAPVLPLPLNDVIILSEKNKKLERTDTGTSQELTEKELALLVFIKAEGEASREDILKNVWGFAPDVDTHTLETHIYRLRQKWRELADYDCIIATDKGYRWHDDQA